MYDSQQSSLKDRTSLAAVGGKDVLEKCYLFKTADNARKRGLRTKPWVKTSLAPGSKVVTEYLKRSGLLKDLEALGFDVVGYGCTTCIGNSGPLQPEIAQAGIGRKFQKPTVFEHHTVFENLELSMAGPNCVMPANSGARPYRRPRTTFNRMPTRN